ncbi:ogr/Delta-like zinc finger family protein [Burkholderia dolosa]|nr:ogr/Delta-like zinc finger family protein [Burkholderia dolosa]
MTSMSIDCPCCGEDLLARHTEVLSPTFRRLYFVCKKCGYKAPGVLEIIHSLSPPAVRRPGIYLDVIPSQPLTGAVNSRTAQRHTQKVNGGSQ